MSATPIKGRDNAWVCKVELVHPSGRKDLRTIKVSGPRTAEAAMAAARKSLESPDSTWKATEPPKDATAKPTETKRPARQDD